ncbi:MAG: hypothetical protein JEZ00_08180 [Anaerolineaceae bacterium]|nr:hypothetical protein [Anaerolineaceae bacterium]
MTPMLSQLLMGFLFVTIGFIAGAAVSYWLLEREKLNVKSEEVPQSKEETIPVDQAYEEVFRIYRDKVSQKILIKIDDQMAPTRVDLNKKHLTLIEKVVREEMDWIGIELPKIPVQVSPIATPKSQITDLLEEDIPSKLVAQIKIPTRKPKKTGDTEANAVVEARSFVEQINDVLQDMLELTPLKDRQIALAEDPKDGVIAWIGSKRYVGIDAIDDPEVQKLIKIAVAKWEKSMEKAARTS